MVCRIANFLPHYPTPGGTTNAVRGLSRALVRRNWGATIYCYAQPGASAEESWEDGVRIVRFAAHQRRNPFHSSRDFLDCLSRNEDSLDLLVLHGMFFPGNLAVGKAATQAAIPYVVCPHDPYHPELLSKGRWRKLVYGAAFERRFLSAASGIQLLSETHREFLSAYNVRTPAFVVPNGFEPDEFTEYDRINSGEPIARHGDPKFLHLGRLDMHHKGLDLLLRGMAMALLEGWLPSTTVLDFVGSDWGDQRKLESLARELGIQPNIRFLGRIPDRSSAAIIAAYDLLILPSRFDGFGLAALEAMVVGKPVVVSAEAGIASFVERAGCGYIVNPEAHAISDGLAHAVQTRDRWTHMGQKGRRFAYDHLTWDNSAEQAIRGYEMILRGEVSDDRSSRQAEDLALVSN